MSPPETLVVKGGTTWARNGRWILPENARLPRNIQGSFTCRKSTTWYKRLYFPSEGRCAEDFFAVKNPTASAGFEPAKLGTKGQHATSRPPKPLCMYSYFSHLLEACLLLSVRLLIVYNPVDFKLVYNKTHFFLWFFWFREYEVKTNILYYIMR